MYKSDIALTYESCKRDVTISKIDFDDDDDDDDDDAGSEVDTRSNISAPFKPFFPPLKPSFPKPPLPYLVTRLGLSIVVVNKARVFCSRQLSTLRSPMELTKILARIANVLHQHKVFLSMPFLSMP